MHCPNCRHENVSTTRFCSACGAVLVESVRGGGRRRVLRPWGLRRAAPLTEAPTLSPLAAGRRAARGASQRPVRRVGVMWATGGVVMAIAGMLVYPRAIADPPRDVRDDQHLVFPAAVVSMPTLSTVRESPLSAPPLVEPASPFPRATTPAVASPRAERVPAAARTRSAAPASEPAVAAVPVEAPVTDEPRAVEPPAPSAPAPAPAVVNRWQPLRDALDACSNASTLWARATCEQRARLAQCDGHWGNVTLCPAGRSEYGQ